MDDIAGYLAIQEGEWGEMGATRGQLESRLEHAGEGMLVAEHDGEIVAGTTFVRLADYRFGEGLSWEELTDSGWCANNDPAGRVLFGVDLSVSRRAPRSTSARLMAGCVELTMRLGVEATYWGSRLPRYHRVVGEMTADQYVNARTARGRYLDPEIEVYSRIPGVVVLGAVADYFKDWESCDYGCILEWRNPIHRYPFLRPLAPRLTGGLYRLDRRRRARERAARAT
jgi:hypothetical protein